MGRMEEIYARFKDQIEFLVVYVQEAHPSDGRQTDSNIEEGVIFRQHQSYQERSEVAATCSLDLNMTLPVLVEEMDNNIDEAYSSAPERLYLVDVEGKVESVKEALANEDSETSVIAAATEELQTALQAVGQAVYEATQAAGGEEATVEGGDQADPDADDDAESGTSDDDAGDSDDEDDDDTVEGEFREV